MYLFICSTEGLHLKPLHQPHFCVGVFVIGAPEPFAWPGSDHDPPDVCLLSS
jgi:hypothetical protein